MLSRSKTDKLDEYRSELLAIQMGEKNTPTNDCWSRLTDYAAKVSPDRLQLAVEDSAVAAKRDALLSSFLVYLFEEHRHAFAALPQYRDMCEEYVSALINASETILQQEKSAMEENEQLKKRIAELEAANGK